MLVRRHIYALRTINFRAIGSTESHYKKMSTEHAMQVLKMRIEGVSKYWREMRSCAQNIKIRNSLVD